MATREELYAKFGITAEAAQLFETELGILLLGSQGAAKGWHVVPDPKAGRKLLDEIDNATLGTLLKRVKDSVVLDDNLKARFASALKARNRLMHGWFERHNFKIQTDEGRDVMMANLEALHDELFAAWRVASVMSTFLLTKLAEHSGKEDMIKIAAVLAAAQSELAKLGEGNSEG